MIRAIQDLIDYTPKFVKITVGLGCMVVAVYFVTPYIKELKHLTSSTIASNEPGLLDRARAFKEYLRYSYRSFKYDGLESDSPPLVRNRAVIKGLDKEGVLHLDVYTIQGRKNTKGKIADVHIKDKNLALALIKKESVNAVIVDTYQYSDELFFVVWLGDGTPLNELIILNSAGEPVKTPPTNIVNRLFKEHYKLIAFNN
jgi:hypothetical protein